MIRLSQVTLRRGAKTLLEGADVSLNPGDRIGLIGANGSGKSSLFALLRGELHADGGDADYPARWRVAHVAQETPALDRSAIDSAIDGDTTRRRRTTATRSARSTRRCWMPTPTRFARAPSSCCTAWVSRASRSRSPWR